MSEPTLKGTSPVQESRALDALGAQLRERASSQASPLSPTVEAFLQAASALRQERAEASTLLQAAERELVAERADDHDVFTERDAAYEALLDATTRTRRRLRDVLGDDAANSYGLAAYPSRQSPADLLAYTQNFVALLQQRPFARDDLFGQRLQSQPVIEHLAPRIDALNVALAEVERERDELTRALTARDAAAARLLQLNRATRAAFQGLEIMLAPA